MEGYHLRRALERQPDVTHVVTFAPYLYGRAKRGDSESPLTVHRFVR